MVIIPLGSRGAVLHLDWFDNNRGIKLVRPASEIENKFLLMANFEAISALGKPENVGHPRK